VTYSIGHLSNWRLVIREVTHVKLSLRSDISDDDVEYEIMKDSQYI
jgi:hypothetical protein